MQAIAPYELFHKLFSASHKVVFVWDIANKQFAFLNDMCGHVWKLDTESITSTPAILFESIHPLDKEYLIKEYHEFVKGEAKQDIEFRIIHPDNSVHWLLFTPHLLADDDGKQYVGGIMDDITSIKENIRNLEKFAAKKNSVLEILSHDLAGPLSLIQALAEELSESTRHYNNHEVEKLIKVINESSARSIRMIRDFVQQEFLEATAVELVRRRVNIAEKIRELIAQYKEGEVHIDKKFTLTCTSNEIFAKIDLSKFMQVLNNLISNAIKFTHDNGHIATDVQEKEDTVLISIRDDGVGIPKHLQHQLFDKFTKARRTGLRGEPSTGLGMSLIKTIVEWHKGRIWFESEENKGTIFYIELPKE